MTLPLKGVGLALRREFFEDILTQPDFDIDFLEAAPEHWLRYGGRLGRELRTLSERYPLACHGLSLDLGGLRPLDEAYLRELKGFCAEHEVRWYSEHLSYCADERGHLYGLMPIPFTQEAVNYVAQRIRRAQDILERRIGVENIVFYTQPSTELSELEFINAVVSEADCDLLLNVNNVLVNSMNFGYDATAFIQALPTQRIQSVQIAAPFDAANDLKNNNQDSSIMPTALALLDTTYQQHGLQPTVLEGGDPIAPLAELMAAVDQVRQAQQRWRMQHG